MYLELTTVSVTLTFTFLFVSKGDYINITYCITGIDPPFATICRSSYSSQKRRKNIEKHLT
jgi:hypothetical protein